MGREWRMNVNSKRELSFDLIGVSINIIKFTSFRHIKFPSPHSSTNSQKSRHPAFIFPRFLSGPCAAVPLVCPRTKFFISINFYEQVTERAILVTCTFATIYGWDLRFNFKSIPILAILTNHKNPRFAGFNYQDQDQYKKKTSPELHRIKFTSFRCIKFPSIQLSFSLHFSLQSHSCVQEQNSHQLKIQPPKYPWLELHIPYPPGHNYHRSSLLLIINYDPNN